MLTLFAIVALVILFAIGLRWRRRREIAAFMDSDVTVLDPALAGVEVVRPVAAGASGRPLPRGVELQGTADVEAEQADEQPLQIYLPRGRPFDDVMRSFLDALDRVLDGHYRVFVHVPVRELVRRGGDRPDPRPLPDWEVSVVICAREDFSLRCGVQLVDGSEGSRRQYANLQQLFAQIATPLVSFRMTTDYSPAEVGERLAGLL